MKLRNKRLIVFSALILIFAIAVGVQLVMSAVYIAPADIGTAVLSDPGDTIFIRDAIFTIDGNQYEATGFTVGDYGGDADPLANVNIDVLTPITKSNPLTGTLDKNIYICGEGTADMFLGTLELAPGRTITAEADLCANFLDGSVTADKITADVINLSGATAVFNSDLNDFKAVHLARKSTLTVNGDMITDKTSSYYIGIGINDSVIMVTGNVEVPECVHLSAKSTGTFSGNVTAGLLGVTDDSSMLIEGNVDVDTTFDATAAKKVEVKGTTETNNLWLQPEEASFGGDVTVNGSLFIRGGTLAFGKDILKRGKVAYMDIFFVNNATVSIAGNVTSAHDFDVENATIEIGGDVTVSGGYSTFRGATIDIHGSAEMSTFNPMRLSKITVGNNLTATNSGWISIGNHASTSVNVGGDFDARGQSVDLINGSLTVTGKILNAGRLYIASAPNSITAGGVGTTEAFGKIGEIHVGNGAGLSLGGSVDAGTLLLNGTNSKLTIEQNLLLGSWVHTNGGSKLTVGGDMSYASQNGAMFGDMEVGGSFTNSAVHNGDPNSGLYVTGTVSVGEDVHFGDFLLNPTTIDKLDVGGDIFAHRIADIKGLPAGKVFNIDGTAFASNSSGTISYAAPYTTDILYLYGNSNRYFADISDLTKKLYTAAKSIISNVNFDAVQYGYTRPDAKAIAIENIDSSAITIDSVSVESGDAGNFDIVDGTPTVDAGSTNTSYTIQPKAGLVPGVYSTTITVTYDGGETDMADLTFVVNKATPSFGVLAFDTTVISYGDLIGVWVIGVAGGAAPTGNISLSLSGTDQGTHALAPDINAASSSIYSLSVEDGTYTIELSYEGDANYEAISASGGTLIIELNVSFITLSVPAANLVYGEDDVVFSVTVKDNQGRGLENGTIAFFNGAELLGTKDLTAGCNGELSFDASALLGAGEYTITAEYAGVVGQAPAVSSAEPLTIEKAAGTFIAPAALNITYAENLTLADLTPPANYVWKDSTTAISATGGGQAFQATYTEASGNYESADGDITVNVAKADRVFGSPTATITQYAPLLSLGDIALPDGYTWDAPETLVGASDTGRDYAATRTDPLGNYHSVGGQITITVTKANQTAITLHDVADFSFGGTPFVPSVTGGTVSGTAAYSYESADGTTYPATADMPTAIGEYKVTAILEGGDNYNDVSVSETFAIRVNTEKDILSIFTKNITWTGLGTAADPKTAAISVANSTGTFSKTSLVWSDYADVVFGKAANPSENADVSLNTGSNTIYLIVTAQDGTEAYYTLTITRNTGSSSGSGTINYTITLEYMEGERLVKSNRASYARNTSLTEANLEIPDGYELAQDSFSFTVTKDETVKIAVKKMEEAPAPSPQPTPEPAGTESLYISGYPDGTFKPNGQITRAEVMQMLYNMQASNAPADLNALDVFDDMTASHWAAAALAWAVENSYIKGYENGTIEPNAPISRAELSTVLHRIAVKENLLDEVGTALVQLSDIDGHWAYDDILALAAKGIAQGYADGTFKPDNSVTRAETVVMIARLFGRTDEFNTDRIFSDVPATHWAYAYIMNAANGN